MQQYKGVLLIVVILLMIPTAMFSGAMGAVWLRTLVIEYDLITIQDNAGNTRMIVSGSNGMPGMTFYDPGGIIRGGFSVLPNGNASLTMKDQTGATRLMLALRGPQNQPELALFGRDGKTKWRLYLDENDVPQIVEE